MYINLVLATGLQAVCRRPPDRRLIYPGQRSPDMKPPGRAGDWPRLVAYDLHGFTASECTAPYADVDTRVAAIRAPRSVRQTPSKCQKDERKKRQRTDARNRTGCFQRNSIDWGLTALPASGGSRNFERGRAKNIYCKV